MEREFDKAYVAALALLQRSDRFEREIRDRLAAYSPETVDLVISRLTERGILNDRRSAGQFVQSRTGRRSLGSGAIADKLQQKGVSDEAVAAATAELDDREIARNLLDSQPHVGPADRGRLGRMLIRKGIDPEIVDSCLDRYFEENPC